VFIAFLASYLVEYGFIRATYLLSTLRNRLDVKTDDLRLSLTTVQPDVQRLAGVNQAQRTH
jgi:hypothetical protein